MDDTFLISHTERVLSSIAVRLEAMARHPVLLLAPSLRDRLKYEIALLRSLTLTLSARVLSSPYELTAPDDSGLTPDEIPY